MKPQVYLDSNDFSLLSDPRRRSSATIAMREELQSYADDELVQFRFSMAHVCEAAPTEPNAQEAAERRAQLIYELCGPNTLVSIAEIWQAEVTGSHDFSPFSNGRWYPQLDELLPKSPMSSMRQMLAEDMKAKGYDRKRRRMEERKIFNKSGVTKGARALMDAASPRTLPDLLAVLPFEPNEVESLRTYVQGGPGWKVVESACHRILANPTWVMGRFAASPSQMDGVTAWLRQGGSDFVDRMKTATSATHDFYRRMRAGNEQRRTEIAMMDDPEIQTLAAKAQLSSQQSLERTMASTRKKMEESILRQCVSRGDTAVGNGVLNLDDLRARCPGIAASVAVGVHASKRASEEITPRQLQASDFGDAMHAFYAPYVHIFRADGFMADVVEKALSGRGTSVARRLTDVPPLIRRHLDLRPEM